MSPNRPGPLIIVTSGQLEIAADYSDDAARLTLTGELDLATAPTLERVIRSVAADGAVTLIEFDLSSLAFMDSQGLAVVVAMLVRRRKRIDVRVTGATPAIRRLIAYSGLSSILEAEHPDAD